MNTPTDSRARGADMQGLSPRNLKYMRAFEATWPDRGFVQQVAAVVSRVFLLGEVGSVLPAAPSSGALPPDCGMRAIAAAGPPNCATHRCTIRWLVQMYLADTIRSFDRIRQQVEEFEPIGRSFRVPV